MSTIREIEEAIPRLSRSEVEALRDWIDDFLEENLELSADTEAKLAESKKEIASGQFATRRPS